MRVKPRFHFGFTIVPLPLWGLVLGIWEAFGKWLGSNHSWIKYLLQDKKGETEVKPRFHPQTLDNQQLAESETGETENSPYKKQKLL